MNYPDLILHIDCNSFYVSCLSSFDPSLIGKAVVVLSNNDGNVIARSALAKAMGIKMGVPFFKVKHLVKKGKLIWFSSNYELFGDMSNRVMNVLRRFSDQVEIYSIDEAFVGMQGYSNVNYMQLAHQIQQTIYRCTRIPVTVGIGPTRTLAKLANKMAKKDPDLYGICKLDSWEQISTTLQEMEVGDLWGIGRRYEETLHEYGIKTACQLISCPDEWIKNRLTIVGLRMIHELRGERRFRLSNLPKASKSVMVAPSFGQPITDLSIIEEALATHIARATEKIRRQSLAANLVTLVIYTNHFRIEEPQHHASQTVSLPYPSNSVSEITHYATSLLRILYKKGYSYRKVGVLLSGLTPDTQCQTQLLVAEPDVRIRKVTDMIDRINLKHGQDTIRFANQGFRNKVWYSKQERKSKCYTTRVQDILQVS